MPTTNASQPRRPFGSPGTSTRGPEVTGYTGGRYHTVLKSWDGRTILDARARVVGTYRTEDGESCALVFALPRGRYVVGYALGLDGMLFRGELRDEPDDDDSEADRAARDVAERWIERDAEDSESDDESESDDDGPSDPPTVPRVADLDPFTRGYLEAALWTSTDDDDEPLDGLYTLDDFADGSLIEAVETCRQFQESGAADLEGRNPSRAGGDFWLTRNRHGAGYWDGDYPEGAGRRLTDAAHAWGSSDAYVGDDGRVYLT
jgi:hypothetical protein